MLTWERKKEIIKILIERLGKLKLAIFANYRGLKVKQIQKLRADLRKEGTDFGVVKNTLLRIALKKKKIEIPPEILDQPLMIAFGYTDSFLPAKKIVEFGKEHPALDILGGIMEGKFISPEQIRQFASIPGKEELYYRLVNSINFPRNYLIYILKMNIFRLVNLLKAIRTSQ